MKNRTFDLQEMKRLCCLSEAGGEKCPNDSAWNASKQQCLPLTPQLKKAKEEAEYRSLQAEKGEDESNHVQIGARAERHGRAKQANEKAEQLAKKAGFVELASKFQNAAKAHDDRGKHWLGKEREMHKAMR